MPDVDNRRDYAKPEGRVPGQRLPSGVLWDQGLRDICLGQRLEISYTELQYLRVLKTV